MSWAGDDSRGFRSADPPWVPHASARGSARNAQSATRRSADSGATTGALLSWDVLVAPFHDVSAVVDAFDSNQACCLVTRCERLVSSLTTPATGPGS
jgi:hypothetical protein